MAQIGHLENREIAIYRQKSSDFDEIWYTTAQLQLDDRHVTKYDVLNSRWRTATILKIVFDHNSAPGFPIYVQFCVGKQFLT